MERSTKFDVYQRTIEEQNVKLEKYQAKLRDVVTAYKELLREKTALEASLKALSTAQNSSSSDTKTTPIAKTQKQLVESTGEGYAVSTSRAGGSAGLQETSSAADTRAQTGASNEGDTSAIALDDYTLSMPESDDVALRHQLSTLAASLSTLTEQKSRLEASYIAEKRKLKQEMEEASKEREELKQRIHLLESDNEEWRNKVRNQQHDREKGLADHAVTIKELQKLIGEERRAREQLENQLEDSRLLLNEKQRIHQSQVQAYERTISDLRRDLENAFLKVNEFKEKAAEPSSLLMHLQKQLIDLKESERRSTMSAQQRADETESTLREQQAQHEAHVAVLEARLAELSESVGSVERLRQQDQQTIQKLRERLVQLDAENSALTSAARSVAMPPVDTNNSTVVDETVEANLDASMLVDKILHLKDLLRNANEKSDKPINICDVLMSGDEKSEVHHKCTEQYEQLREEYERYKLRAQSILKNKAAATPKDQSVERETAMLRSQLSELRDRVATLRLANDEQESTMRDKEEGFARALAALRESHRAELAEREAVHRARIAELESDMRRHRDRTVSMLAERDRELATVRLQVATDRLMATPGGGGTAVAGQFGSYTDAGGIGASSVEMTAPANAIVSELISNVEISDDSKILHFANERSRYETELSALRRQKHSLETALRDVRRDAALTAESHADELRRLTEEIAKRDRDRSRENANLEYLKNVVHRYMMCRGGISARQQMLNAISTILQFSPAEKQQVQDHIARGWWVVAKPT